MNNKLTIGIVVVLAILVVGVFLMGRDGTADLAPEDVADETSQVQDDGARFGNATFGDSTFGDDSDSETEDGGVVVTYTAGGFVPSEVTVNVGDSVTWVNESGRSMWVASALHPTHMVYAGTDLQTHCSEGATSSFDQCSDGAEYTFTFDKAGTWRYHDHLRASQTGSVIVEE